MPGDLISFELGPYAYKGMVAEVNRYDCFGFRLTLENGSIYYFRENADLADIYNLKFHLENCPFCGKDESFLLMPNRNNLYVNCKNCYAEGPYGNSNIEAIRLWNGRIS